MDASRINVKGSKKSDIDEMRDQLIWKYGSELFVYVTQAEYRENCKIKLDTPGQMT